MISRARTIHWTSALQIQRLASKEAKPKVGQRIRAPALIPVAIGKELAEVEARLKEAKLLSV